MQERFATAPIGPSRRAVAHLDRTGHYAEPVNSAAPRTVLFDLDGTLADTVPLIVATFRRTVSESLGWEPTVEQCKAWIGRSLTETFQALAPERADELIDHYLEWNLANHHAYVRQFDGVGGLIDALRASGRSYGVVTSKRHTSALLSLECAGLTGLPLLATEEDTVTHKPAPEPLLYALSRLRRPADTPRAARRCAGAGPDAAQAGCIVPVSRKRWCQLSDWRRSCGVCSPLQTFWACSKYSCSIGR
jgi:pyrophosphatase PpaX